MRPPPAVTWDVDVLGPVRVRPRGHAVPLVDLPARERALLALLALAEGHPVSADSLTEDLWSGRPPDGARNTLQVYVSHLRRTMGRDTITSVSGGYQLCLDVCRIDVMDFMAALRRGSQSLRERDYLEAHRELSAALDLVRGDPLEDLGDYAFAGNEAAKLMEAQATAAEHLAEALLSVEGGEQSVLDQVWPLLAQHPYRERMRGAIMTALFRGGRAVDALRVYDDGRRLLREELGLDPGQELQMLQASILAGDPSLRATHSRLGSGADRLPPKPLTPMFGRDEDVEHVSSSAAEARLMTVVGPGGVGKTRLALECAHAMAQDPRWTVHWIDLQDQPSAVGIPLIVASALGRGGTGLSLVDLANSVAHEGPLLLVLDNVEHLLPEAASTIAELVGRAANITLIATSRVPLGVPGEKLHRLHSLPPPGDIREAMTPASSPALHMFLDQAKRASPKLDVTPQTLADAARICLAVDGLPLAVQLAAARLSTMTLPEIVSALTASPETVLAASHSSLAHRHRSLSETLAWSERLLEPSARRLFAWLSVFEGGFTVDAVNAVWKSSDESAQGTLPALLESLVEASLVQRDHEDGRFRFVVAAHQLAARRLVDAGEEAAAKIAHARYFAGTVASGWVSTPESPRSVLEARWYDLDHHNLRAACETTERHGLATEYADLVACGAGYWVDKGETDLVSGWLEGMLEKPISLSRRSDAHFWLSAIAAEGGTMSARLHHLGLSHEAAHEAQDANRRVRLQAALATAYASAGDFGRAAEHHSVAMRLLVKISDPHTKARVLTFSVAAIRHNVPKAKAQLLQGVHNAELSGSETALVHGLNNLADMCASAEEYEEAIHWASAGLRHEMAAHDIRAAAYLSATLGVALILQGDYARARPTVREAFRAGTASGSEGLRGGSALLMACLLASEMRDEEAAVLFGWHEVRRIALGDALQGPELAAFQRYIVPVQEKLGTPRFEFLMRNGSLLSQATVTEWMLADREPAELDILRSGTSTGRGDSAQPTSE